MPADVDPDREALAALADELSLPTDGVDVEAVLSFARDLADAVPDDPPPDVESIGRPGDDAYNAFLAVYPEPRSTGAGGPLDGLSVAVKDNIAARGLEMTCGARGFSHVPSFDAVVVERLLDAGACLVGKTNMDAYAFGPAGQWSGFGQVTNPVAPDRVPGGSSSGSGAAVAAGLVDAALGTDTGGSVRSPAACCGVVGVKPTHRLVPRFGFVENMPSTDVIGPLARDVDTAARVLEAVAGHDPRDPTSAHAPVDGLADLGASPLDADGPIAVGLVESSLDLVTDEVASAIEATADALADDGATVRPVDLEFGDVDRAYPLSFGALRRQGFVTRGDGTGYDREWRTALSSARLTDHVAERLLPGALLDRLTDGASYVAAREEVRAFGGRLDELFRDVDVLLCPTLRMLPPEPGAVRSAEEGLKYSLTKPFSLARVPAVSVPAGDVDGVPVSAQVVAPQFEDRRALRVAKTIEATAR